MQKFYDKHIFSESADIYLNKCLGRMARIVTFSNCESFHWSCKNSDFM